MARISDVLESMIKQMIEDNDGFVEITRNALADQVNCVPSQITYVLSTRFTYGHGYLVESRRGGGGMIRIRRVEMASPAAYLMHALNNIGDQLSQHEAEVLIRNFRDYDILNHREARLIMAATSDRCLSEIGIERKDRVRMEIFKNMLTSLIVQDLQ
jgi:transcriptional regulator CtsR